MNLVPILFQRYNVQVPEKPSFHSVCPPELERLKTLSNNLALGTIACFTWTATSALIGTASPLVLTAASLVTLGLAVYAVVAKYHFEVAFTSRENDESAAQFLEKRYNWYQNQLSTREEIALISGLKTGVEHGYLTLETFDSIIKDLITEDNFLVALRKTKDALPPQSTIYTELKNKWTTFLTSPELLGKTASLEKDLFTRLMEVNQTLNFGLSPAELQEQGLALTTYILNDWFQKDEDIFSDRNELGRQFGADLFKQIPHDPQIVNYLKIQIQTLFRRCAIRETIIETDPENFTDPRRRENFSPLYNLFSDLIHRPKFWNDYLLILNKILDQISLSERDKDELRISLHREIIDNAFKNHTGLANLIDRFGSLEAVCDTFRETHTEEELQTLISL